MKKVFERRVDLLSFLRFHVNEKTKKIIDLKKVVPIKTEIFVPGNTN
jgi:hypothetical protein